MMIVSGILLAVSTTLSPVLGAAVAQPQVERGLSISIGGSIGPILYKTFLRIGCWSDDPSYRILHDFQPSVQNVTIEKCIDVCSKLDRSLAGVEFGRECFCGNAILNDHQIIPRSNCNVACEGKAKEMCGGDGAMTMYLNLLHPFVTFGPPFLVTKYKDWKYLQCTKDDVSHRQVPQLMESIPHEELTVQRCLDTCAAGNYSVGAVQWGQECWCGNVALPFIDSDIANCNSPCTDEANQFCGGRGYNQVYYLPSAQFTTSA